MVRFYCENIFLDGSDLQSNKFWQAIIRIGKGKNNAIKQNDPLSHIGPMALKTVRLEKLTKNSKSFHLFAKRMREQRNKLKTSPHQTHAHLQTNHLQV